MNKKNYKPKITIITVVLNDETHIEKTILSIINQNYSNIEYIIIDGKSEDDTLKIINKYKDQINYFISEKDDGIYDAMNKGIIIATGEWINFMNSGDYFFESNTLEKIQQYLSEDLDLVYGNHSIYNTNTNYSIEFSTHYNNPRWHIPFCHQSLFVKNDILKKHFFDLKYQISSDYNQFLHIKKAGHSIKHIPVTIATYLDGGLSAKARKKRFEEYREIQKKFYPTTANLVYLFKILKLYITRK